MRDTFRTCAKNIIRLTVTIMLGLSASGQTSTNFYVAPWGNDELNGRSAELQRGTPGGPVASIQRAMELVRETLASNRPGGPITVYLRGGVYELENTLQFTPADSGTEISPVTYTSYPGEKPIVSGGTRIDNWIWRDGIWNANLPEVAQGQWNFTQLFVNGERRSRPRLPAEGYYEIDSLVDPVEGWLSPTHRFRFDEGQMSEEWINRRDIEAVVLHHWVDVHLPVKSIDETNSIVEFQKSSFIHIPDKSRYYLTNVAEAMDAPGEWYLDRALGRLSYVPREGEYPSTTEVFAPRLETLIDIRGTWENPVENLTFRGLTFAHNEWTLPADDAGDYQAGYLYPGAVRMVGAQNVTFLNNTFRNLGTYAIEIGEDSTRNVVAGCEIYDTGAGGIKLSGPISYWEGTKWCKPGDSQRTTDNYILGNHLHHLGQILHGSAGILIQYSARNLIAHNEIHDLPYTGISLGWLWEDWTQPSADNRIENNYIHDVGSDMLADLGGIYVVGGARGSIIRNNLIRDIDAHQLGIGIYLDEGSSGLLVENNVVHETQFAGVLLHWGRDNVIRNNIVANGSHYLLGVGHDKSSGLTVDRNVFLLDREELLVGSLNSSHYEFDYNLYHRAGSSSEVRFGEMSFQEWKAQGHDQRSIIADPGLIMNDESVDLSPDSPAFQLGFEPIDMTTVGLRNWSDDLLPGYLQGERKRVVRRGH